jgi:hypothetical protein
MQAGFAFLREPAAEFAAGLCFAIEALGDRGWTPRVAESHYLDLEVAAFGPDGEPISDADLARCADRLVVRLNPAQFNGTGGEVRVLKKRAAQSHLSRRAPFIHRS